MNAANLTKIFGQCHQGSAEILPSGPCTFRPRPGPPIPWFSGSAGFTGCLIPLTLGFMVLHNGSICWQNYLPPAKSGKRPAGHSNELVVSHRALGAMLSFPTFVFTGFALKYPDSWWSAPFLLWGKHQAFRGVLHRTAAVVLISATLYHLVHLAVNRRDRVFLRAMLPKWKDVTDLVDVLRYNLGLRQQEPQFEKFNYAEKLEIGLSRSARSLWPFPFSVV